MVNREKMAGLLLALVLMSPLGAGAGVLPAPSPDEQIIRNVEQSDKGLPTLDHLAGQEHYASIKGREVNKVVQGGGNAWRELRNGPLALMGGVLLLVVPTIILLFYAKFGQLKLHGTPTGRLIRRFSTKERILHWTTAGSFTVLALTGIVIFFGKKILLPVFGYNAFSWLAMISKTVHNFVGPLFILASILMFVTFLKDNFFKKHDLMWIKKGGGLASGEHIPSDKFNAGEKLWFWGGLSFLGLIVGISGLILDFPNFDQSRLVMQGANVVHAIFAVLYMAGALGHIYMGTIGMQGAFKAMKTGVVDETWAKEHHEYWYNALKAESSAAPAKAVPPASPAEREKTPVA